ncbi:MAG: hypothetical protein P4L66_02030, partial [Acetobacteraceae bacterium]|nr:hypothetical protein [Acetobacteraceae bacterium]
HTVTVGDFVSFFFWLQLFKGGVGQHGSAISGQISVSDDQFLPSAAFSGKIIFFIVISQTLMQIFLPSHRKSG